MGDETVSVGFCAYFGGVSVDEEKNDGDWKILGVRGMDTQWYAFGSIVTLVNALKMPVTWRVSVCVNEGEPLKLQFWISDGLRLDFFVPGQNL